MFGYTVIETKALEKERAVADDKVTILIDRLSSAHRDISDLHCEREKLRAVAEKGAALAEGQQQIIDAFIPIVTEHLAASSEQASGREDDGAYADAVSFLEAAAESLGEEADCCSKGCKCAKVLRKAVKDIGVVIKALKREEDAG